MGEVCAMLLCVCVCGIDRDQDISRKTYVTLWLHCIVFPWNSNNKEMVADQNFSFLFYLQKFKLKMTEIRSL